jgi:hypothetical protein
VRNAFGEIAYNLNKKACEDIAVRKRKNEPSHEDKSLSGCMAVLAASTIFVGLYFIALIINAILSPPRCIPPESGYTPEIPVPSQAVEVHEGLQLIRGSYTIQNFSQMEVMEFFEAELDAHCLLDSEFGVIRCSGEVDELTDFYIVIAETKLETQSTAFSVSFDVPWCDEWPE